MKTETKYIIIDGYNGNEHTVTWDDLTQTQKNCILDKSFRYKRTGNFLYCNPQITNYIRVEEGLK